MMEEVDLSDTPLALHPQMHSQDSVTFGDEDPPDPRIQVELERLNTSTDLINKLEVDLDEARMMFRQTLSESTQRIDYLTKKLGKCVDQARPYYDARIKAKQALNEAQKSAVRYERAVSQHAAAREMVQLAEEGLMSRGCIFDSTWQEMLNHATTKVNDAEREKIESTSEHKDISNVYHEAETRVKYLQKELKRAIAKSSLNARRSLMQLSNIVRMQDLQLLPYFELKAAVNQRLEEQKRHVRELERAVTDAKNNYAQALTNLETISDEIHKNRQTRVDLGIRGVGVGAESPGPPFCTKNAEVSLANKNIRDTSEVIMKENQRSQSVGKLTSQSASSASQIPSTIFVKDISISLADLSSSKEVAAKSELSRERKCSLGNPVEEVGAEQTESGQGSDFIGWQFVAFPGVSSSGSNLLGIDDKESNISDSESLTSMEMLSEEAIANLMLEDEINEATQSICSPLVDEFLAPPPPRTDLSPQVSPQEIDSDKYVQKVTNCEPFPENSLTISNQCKDSETSRNSSSDSGGTWEVVSDTQDSASEIGSTFKTKEGTDVSYLGMAMGDKIKNSDLHSQSNVFDTEITKEKCVLNLSEKVNGSPTRPQTLPVSPSYCKSTLKVSSESDTSDHSSPDTGSTPAYAPLCDTPDSLHNSVNI